VLQHFEELILWKFIPGLKGGRIYPQNTNATLSKRKCKKSVYGKSKTFW
jgi:hypothetical protein